MTCHDAGCAYEANIAPQPILFELDAEGNNVFGCAYRAEDLGGTRAIAGHAVKCVPPDRIIAFHAGYRLDENDHRDVKALCQKFGIEMPEEHKAY